MSGLSLPVLWPKKCLQAESRGNHKIPLCVASFSLLLRDHILVPSIVQCLTIVEVSLLLIVLLKLSQILSVGTPSRWFFFYVLLTCPYSFYGIYILPSTIRCSKLILYFPFPRPRIGICKKICYLSVKNDNWRPNVTILCGC